MNFKLTFCVLLTIQIIFNINGEENEHSHERPELTSLFDQLESQLGDNEHFSETVQELEENANEMYKGAINRINQWGNNKLIQEYQEEAIEAVNLAREMLIERAEIAREYLTSLDSSQQDEKTQEVESIILANTRNSVNNFQEACEAINSIPIDIQEYIPPSFPDINNIPIPPSFADFNNIPIAPLVH